SSVPSTNAVIGTTDYRYYTTDTSTGYSGGLEYVFDDQSDARARAAGIDPATSTDDASLQQYATNYFQYHNESGSLFPHAVSLEIAHGSGCSCTDTNGQGQYTYDYEANPNYGGID